MFCQTEECLTIEGFNKAQKKKRTVATVVYFFATIFAFVLCTPFWFMIYLSFSFIPKEIKNPIISIMIIAIMIAITTLKIVYERKKYPNYEKG